MSYETKVPLNENLMCLECAWENPLDVADAGVGTGEVLLLIVNELLEAHPDDRFGPYVAKLATALPNLRHDVEAFRNSQLVLPEITELN